MLRLRWPKSRVFADSDPATHRVKCHAHPPAPAPPPAPDHEILLSQRFLPEHGGSIRWMYEVYRRWPRPVEVITHNYYDYPPRTPEFPHQPQRPGGTGGPGGPGGDHVTDANLTVERHDIFLHDWGLQSLDNWKRYWRMMRAVGKKMPGRKRLRIHCTHALPEVLSLWPLRWRLGKRIGIICYVHGEEITACRSSRQLRPMLNRAFKLADLLLANSQYTADLACEHADPDKIRIVHPGVQITEFDDAAQLGDDFRKENNLQDRLIVLTLGRLDPRKNQMAVLDAIAALANQFANLVYIIAGEGRQADCLKERAEKLGITSRVRFTGPVDGRMKRALFGCCDIFAMPAVKVGTDVEGFGIVFLEAGACGKPALAGRSGGQADAVEDERSGLVVDGYDHQAVTASLKRLLADADLRKRMGQAGREKALSHDWSKVVQHTVELVEEIQSA